MPEFFLELFSEEIPARMQAAAAEQLATIASGYLRDIKPSGTRVHKFYGARRIAIAFDVQPKVNSMGSQQRGPRSDAPNVAIEGFLKKNSSTRENLRVEEGYFILTTETPERSAREVVLEKLPKNLAILPWPKAMRWGQSEDFNWIRPLRRIICLLDGEVVPIKLGTVVAGNETEGNRTDAERVFSVRNKQDWVDRLRAHNVIADEGTRASLLQDGMNLLAKELTLTVVHDDALVREVTGLVEWPVPLIGRIDADFMSLPPEVRELSMKVNQKYFALRDAAGQPAPYFAFVANLEAPDGGKAIIGGNERVLRARLADARHFWDRDLTTPLNELLPKLDGIVFHAKIGTQLARAERIATLAAEIADMLGADESATKQAAWAGRLCKADLVTGMVGEFPELQGIMGGYYAEQAPKGWDGAVVGPAIKSHYQPKGPGDAVPTGTVAVSVALADKIDTLREFFRIGEVPTGSGDPYALRRAALGVIRIILENELRLPLRPLLGGDEKLFAFIIERLRVKLRGEGRRFDVLDAVLGAGTDDDLTRVMQRVDAVSAFLAGPDGANLIVAYRRAANILRIEDAKDGPHRGADLQRLSGSAEETAFAEALAEVQNQTVEEFLTGRYDQAMTALARLRAPVDAFFDKVTVNAPEPELRLNRLRLLALLRDTMNQIADFSRVEN